MGPSGSGKSTLLNLVGLLDTIDAGQYVLDGADVSSLNDSKLARSRNQRIGFIFQSFNLFRQHTVLGNIEVPMTYLGIPLRQRRERKGTGQRRRSWSPHAPPAAPTVRR